MPLSYILSIKPIWNKKMTVSVFWWASLLKNGKFWQENQNPLANSTNFMQLTKTSMCIFVLLYMIWYTMLNCWSLVSSTRNITSVLITTSLRVQFKNGYVRSFSLLKPEGSYSAFSKEKKMHHERLVLRCHKNL